MRMQKEEKIVVVLLLMALGSLAVAFWAFSPEEGELESSSDSVSQKDAGLSVEGLVLEIKPTKNGGNLLLKLDSTQLPIFIPARAGAKEIQARIRVGDQVKIRGIVSTFQDNEELVISRQSDIQVLTA
ncbi:MAG: OB-fold nucleic acid binding domain-containing protein [Methanothrix sp.]